eukprot:g1440.t1
MPDRSILSLLVLSLVWIAPAVLAGSCGGEGVFEGEGNFNGEGLFESESGTFDGTGLFIGKNQASFEGAGNCIFNATVYSVHQAMMNVTGNGKFSGRGRLQVDNVSFDFVGTVEGDGIKFTGVGTFDGEGTVERGGRINVYGASFECTGNGRLAGAGSFEGEGSMRALGSLTGRGSFNGSGLLSGTGFCRGSNTKFTEINQAPVTEDDEDEVNQETIEKDL